MPDKTDRLTQSPVPATAKNNVTVVDIAQPSITLTSGGRGLTDKDSKFWFMERYQTGFKQEGKNSLEERMKMGENFLEMRTSSDGEIHVSFPKMDEVTNIHHSYQVVVRFNTEDRAAGHRPVETPHYQYCAVSKPDPPLESRV